MATVTEPFSAIVGLFTHTDASGPAFAVGACSQFVLHATNGKAVFITLEDSYLVVVFDQFADVSQASKEVQETALRIRRASRLG